MKALSIFLMILFFSICIHAQNDTIEITQFKSTQLVFNEEVTYVEAGTGDLQVKSKIVDNILIIQSIVPAEDFIGTNLFIKTKTNIYNPILKFSNSPKRTTLLEQNLKSAIQGIPVRNKTPDKNQIASTSKQPVVTLLNLNSNSTAETSLITSITEANDLFKPSRQYTTGVWFKFYAHYILNGKFYFKFVMENESDLDYNVEHFFFSVKNKKKRNATETQREVNTTNILTPIEVIPAQSTKTIIFEFASFSINKDEEFLVELKEKNGARNFTIGIPYYIINQPLILKK